MESRRRGKTGTKKSQGYKNKTAYKLMYRDDKIGLRNNTVLDRLCPRCYETISWKLKYGKYKPIKSPQVCNACHKKAIVKPYRNLCNTCSDTRKACSKCEHVRDYHEKCDEYKSVADTIQEKKDIDKFMKMLQERSRRRIQRLLENKEIEWKKKGKQYVDVETGEPLEGLHYQKKYWKELGIEGADELDDLDF